jgi:hypothetical protein
MFMASRGNKGFALFVTLMISGLMVMLLSVTIFSARGGSVFTQDYYAKTAAFCAAETGLAILQQRLEASTDFGSFAETANSEATPFGTGVYSYRWDSSHCINNLKGNTPVAGPYGDIPPRSAYLKVEGEALGHVETIECVIGRKDSDFITSALVASGKIFFAGDVEITGERSHDHLTKIPSDVISNYAKDSWTGTVPLHYERKAGDSARIDGVVRSASPRPDAISSDLRAAADEALTDQAPVPLANIDVAAEVRSRSSYDAPPAMGGEISGNLYQSGNYMVPGDLVLNDANLYVDGNLTVIGSISGRGSVYASGSTTFSGDSMVASQDTGVALYSQGNVTLTGFDGSQFMDAFTAAAGGDYPAMWQQAKLNMGLISDYLDSGDPRYLRVYNSDSDYFWGSEIGKLINILSNDADLSVSPHPTLPTSQVKKNSLYHLGKLLEGQSSPSGRFMHDKMKALRSGPATKGYPPSFNNLTGALGITYYSPTHVQEMREFLETGALTDGNLNHFIWVKVSRLEGNPQYAAVTDPEVDLGLRKITNWMRNYEYDKLGSSYFKGAIYTRGALYAANEVTVVGSIAVVADPSQADNTPAFTPVDGVSLRPGDVHLANGTNITHVADLIPGSQPGGARVGVSYWIK